MVVMGFDFVEDRRDVGISCDHGRIQLFLESLPTSLVRIAWRRARLVRCLQGVCFGFEAGMSRKRRFAGRFQFRLLGISQETHVVVVEAA